MIALLVVLIVVFIIWCIGVWIWDANHFVLREYTIYSEKIKKPYHFALLADLHNKAYGKENIKLAQAIKELQIESIMIAGDMYTSRGGGGFENAAALLKQIAGKCPVYYANGNHEQKTKLFPDVHGTIYQQYQELLKELHVIPLINAKVMLEEYGISISGSEIGREYYQRLQKREFSPDYLEHLLGQAEKEQYQILIAHNPEYFPEYGQWGADLVVSGHIHGGVVKLPWFGGVISPSVKLFPKYDGGLFKWKEAIMVLSRGLGMHTIPIRMWNPAELVVIKLEPK